MVPRHRIVCIAEDAFPGVGAWTIGRQPQPLAARMRRYPALDGLRLVDFVMIHDHIEPVPSDEPDHGAPAGRADPERVASFGAVRNGREPFRCGSPKHLRASLS